MQWSAELNARITTVFFTWLVGPMDLEADDVVFNGQTQRWRSKVKIKKCRYLEVTKHLHAQRWKIVHHHAHAAAASPAC